jgi:hypothetical protein
MLKIFIWVATIIATTIASGVFACTSPASVCERQHEGSFALIQDGQPAAVLVEKTNDVAVQRVAKSFAEDLKRVSGRNAPVVNDRLKIKKPVIVIGTIGESQLINDLIGTGKLDVSALKNQWEAFSIGVVKNPWPGVEQALVVAGSDRRGTIFGAYDISEKMGVSPWHWFADVPVRQSKNIYISAGSRSDQPGVRYRGFFINDEDPTLSSWAEKKFGGVNAKMYVHVFELILRMKGNYLWPAMWAPKAFHLDDPRNGVLADEMGVVIGSSHHEPLSRAQNEWHRLAHEPGVGGHWNYVTNAENLRAFWRGGLERMMSKGKGQSYESLLTIGMRGDGDEPMAEGTATDLLEKVVKDQRQLIADVTGKPADQTPQVWALYKEVQDYYDKGMSVPEDVTLLFADDNWGQIRRLPTRDLNRKGGFGVYYHFDYVGVPRNYKWLNTVQIEKVWQQMNLAYERDAKNIWVVNVGDIKPMEYPLDFFMKMAWDPQAMTPQALEKFPENWAERTFGAELAPQIGELITRYSQYAARRKPELINETSFALGDVTKEALIKGEFDLLVDQWRELVIATHNVKKQLKPYQHHAYFQLIEYPVTALANLYEMYLATAWNRRLASHHDARANYFLKVVEETFSRDAELTAQYHKINGGKWDGIMNQVHMNYIIWNEPTQQTMPSVIRVAADKPVHDRNPPVVFASPSSKAAASSKQSDAIFLDASAFNRSNNAAGVSWLAINNLGQSKAAMIGYPQGQPATTIEDDVRLEYDFSTPTSADLHIVFHVSPTLDTIGANGIRFAVSLDGSAPKVVNFTLLPTSGAQNNPGQVAWAKAVINNGHQETVAFTKVPAGKHTLKVWRIDDNLVLEKIEIKLDKK